MLERSNTHVTGFLRVKRWFFVKILEKVKEHENKKKILWVHG